MLMVLAGDQDNVRLLQRSANEVPSRVREFPPKADPKLDLSLPFMPCSQSQGIDTLLCQAIANCCWALRQASRNKLMKAATACCRRFTRCPLRYVRTRESFNIQHTDERVFTAHCLGQVSFTFREVVAQDVQRRLGQFELQDGLPLAPGLLHCFVVMHVAAVQDLAGITSVLILGEPNMQAMHPFFVRS